MLEFTLFTNLQISKKDKFENIKKLYSFRIELRINQK